MIEGTFAPLRLRVLVVDDELTHDTAEGRAARLLVTDLEARNLDVVQAISAADGMAVVTSDAVDPRGADGLDCSTTTMRKLTKKRRGAARLHPRPQRQDSDLPDGRAQRFGEAADRGHAAGRRVHLDARGHRVVRQRSRRGRGAPLHRSSCCRRSSRRSGALRAFTNTRGTHRATRAAPAFLKSPVGRVFYDYFGENLLRSDLSISVGELGSLLDHTGPIGESEKYAARVFGAHRTYCVTNGTSTANRLILTAVVTRDQIALCDRNCHKSIEHGLTSDRRHSDVLRPSAKSLGHHRSDPSGSVQEGVDREGDRVESARARRHRHDTGVQRRDEFDVRRPVLQRGRRREAARRHRRPRALGRGVVRLRALQSDLSQPVRHARRSEGSHRSDRVRDAFDAQAARGAVAGVVPAHPRRHAARFRMRVSTNRS